MNHFDKPFGKKQANLRIATINSNELEIYDVNKTILFKDNEVPNVFLGKTDIFDLGDTICIINRNSSDLEITIPGFGDGANVFKPNGTLFSVISNGTVKFTYIDQNTFVVTGDLKLLSDGGI